MSHVLRILARLGRSCSRASESILTSSRTAQGFAKILILECRVQDVDSQCTRSFSSNYRTSQAPSSPGANEHHHHQELAGITYTRRNPWNLISCNAQISRLAQQGRIAEAFAFYFRMQDERVNPNALTFLSLLKAFAGPSDLESGKRAHSLIIKARKDFDVRVGTALVCMYFRCGSVTDARQVFATLPKRDEILWNAMIDRYLETGFRKEAIELFRQMEAEGVKRSQATFLSVLKTCNGEENLEEGKQLHREITSLGLESDVRVQTALVSMYCKCGGLAVARQLFDKFPRKDVIIWTTMISGYVDRDFSEEAFNLFRSMRKAGVRPTMPTFLAMLKACKRPELLQQGKWLHGHIVSAGFEMDERVGTALIIMYSRCQSLVDAQKVFDKIPQKNVISWTALISGYSCNGHNEEALKLYEQMQHEGVKPNEVTMGRVMNAYARLGAV